MATEEEPLAVTISVHLSASLSICGSLLFLWLYWRTEKRHIHLYLTILLWMCVSDLGSSTGYNIGSSVIDQEGLCIFQ
ncbi:hypothetical protein SARC_16344, partial [Sphaeroforma arctica JP610]